MKAVSIYSSGIMIVLWIAIIVFSAKTDASFNSPEWWTELLGVVCLVGLFLLLGTIRIVLELATAKSREVQEKQRE